jgi:hypothetical protein
VTNSSFHLSAEVSSDSLTAIRPVLEQIVGGAITEAPKGFHVDASIEGTDARELNRDLLPALRRVERRTHLRSEWTADGVTHRSFDYVLKNTRPALPISLEADGTSPSRQAPGHGVLSSRFSHAVRPRAFFVASV